MTRDEERTVVTAAQAEQAADKQWADKLIETAVVMHDSVTGAAIHEPNYASSLYPPTLDELEAQLMSGVVEAACPESCEVEPDGHCPHGHPAWSIVAGIL